MQLQPNDQILAVNGEDVKEAQRDHVIQLVRSCEHQVSLLVCQPEQLPCSPGRKSTLLSPARKEKLRNKRPSRVRFAESVCVNGAPLFPVSKTIDSHRITCSHSHSHTDRYICRLYYTYIQATKFFLVQLLNRR